LLYFLSLSSNQYCCCGFKKEDHELEASRELSLGSLERLAWNSERDTTPMETDAFGEMEFSSQTQKLCKVEFQDLGRQLGEARY